MSVLPVPSAFETRSNATFDAIMWAFARPGMTRDLPEEGMAQIVEALIDRECAVHCANPELANVARAAGALMVAPDAADHIFVEDVPLALLDQLRCGSDLHPDDGATLIACADLSGGSRVRMTGPGVDGKIELLIGGLPADFWHRRARAMRYPMGFEILLVDGARILGVPRSTVVEVL